MSADPTDLSLTLTPASFTVAPEPHHRTGADHLVTLIDLVVKGEGLTDAEAAEILRDLAEWYDPRQRFAPFPLENGWESITASHYVDVE